MRNRETLLGPLLAAAAAAIALAVYVTRSSDLQRNGPLRSATPILAAGATGAAEAATPSPIAPPQSQWAVSAPGRVEPRGGEIRLSPQSGGRIADVLVAANDRVMAGDLLIKLDDSDAAARLDAAESEASVRRRDRDQEQVTGAARDWRAAQDTAYAAERLHRFNRAELDRWVAARKAGLAADADVAKARDTVVKAAQALDVARLTLRQLGSSDTPPVQSRLDAALAAARAEVSVAEAAAERLRIRAPHDGTILQLTAVPGEGVAPSPENVVAILGDLGGLRVKAEIDERDIGKVRLGQSAVIRSDAFPGRDFDGRVVSISQSLAPSRLGLKGPRKLVDTDVLEAVIDLVGDPAILPGMRVDVFLRPAVAASAPAAAVKVN